MKKNNFSYKDSSLIYLFAIFTYFLISFVFSQVLHSYSVANNIEMSQLFLEKWVIYINAILSEIGYLIVFIVFSYNKKVNIFASSYNKQKIKVKNLLIVFLLTIVLFFSSLNFVNFCNYLFSLFAKPISGNVPISNIGELALSIVCFALLPAICEELIFRGAIFNSLNKKFGVVASVLISSLIFVVVHYSIYQTVYQFLLGSFLCLIFYFTGNLIYSMVAHFINNSIVLIVAYFSKNFFQFSFFGALEIIISIACFVVGILIVVGVFLMIKKNKDKQLSNINIENNQTIVASESNATDSDGLSTFCYIATFVFCLIVWATNSFGG